MSSPYLLRMFRAGVVGIGAAVLSVLSAAAASAEETEDTENFSFPSWDVSYEISLDSDGRAHAQVTEQLEALFPDSDQNRGIVRSLPLRYQGAPAAPENISITDDDGNEVPFETEDEDGFRSILVGDDSFVHGEQTYVISYTVSDVMHATDEADEFYWDLVPVDRNQDIETVTAEVTLGPQLNSALTGSSACYRGTPDDSQVCTIEAPEDGSAGFTVEEQDLPGGQGLTAAIGVEPGTVTQPPEREDSFALDVLPLLLSVTGALVAAGGSLAALAMIRRRRQTDASALPHYEIRESMTPLIAGPVVGAQQNPLVPTILDLAVRGAVRIVDSEEGEGWFSKKPKPVLELVDPELASDPLEAKLLSGLFPELQPGDVFTFPTNDKVFTKTSQEVLKAGREAAVDRGYLEPLRHRGAALAGWIGLGLQIPVMPLILLGASRDNTVTTTVSVVVAVVTIALTLTSAMKHRVHTPSGAETRAQLQQVRQMMKTSEAERLQMMQPYARAGRSSGSSRHEGGSGVVELYDQLLPYAVLFGLQKDWAVVLTNTYHQHQLSAPFWYPALFANGPQGMESSLTSMLSSVSSAAGTSSSGAGSTGGGAAGGGGGGGAAGGR